MSRSYLETELPDLEQDATTELLPQVVVVEQAVEAFFADPLPFTGDNSLEIESARDKVTAIFEELDAAPTADVAEHSSLGEKPRAEVDLTRIKIRGATEQDIEAMVDLDLRLFNNVYKNYGISAAEHRQELIEKFRGRLARTGGDFIQLLESEGNLLGFIIGCPTSKSPADFKSWEDTTDNGTLETTYDPDGEYIYIVSLNSSPTAEKANASNMLQANMIGKMLEDGYKSIYFESRVPGLKKWAKLQCRKRDLDFALLTEEQKNELAQEYFGLTKTVDGKSVPHDPLLRRYRAIGCKLEKIAPNAYQDEMSMNYGVVCVYESPLPQWLQKSKLATKVAGKALRLASHFPKLMAKLF
jgi:hypothetical protein